MTTTFTETDPKTFGLRLALDFIDLHRRGDVMTCDAILSAFPDAETRRAFLVMVAALRACGADPEYRDAMKKALCDTLYDMMGGKRK